MDSKEMAPGDIERRSFEIITEELGGRTFPPLEEPVVKRVIHTTADFSYADSLVFTHDAAHCALDALRAGATGYVLKERDDIEVSLSIRSVLRGGAPIDPFIARRILEMLPVPTPVTCPLEPGDQHPALTEREQQILRLVADGLSNREIADQLFLSRYTVESHVKRVYRKLAVSSRTGAVREAGSRGWLG